MMYAAEKAPDELSVHEDVVALGDGLQRPLADVLVQTATGIGYSCADVATGKVLGHVGIKHAPSGISNVVSLPSGLYVGALDGLARIYPGPYCSGG